MEQIILFRLNKNKDNQKSRAVVTNINLVIWNDAISIKVPFANNHYGFIGKKSANEVFGF